MRLQLRLARTPKTGAILLHLSLDITLDKKPVLSKPFGFSPPTLLKKRFEYNNTSPVIRFGCPLFTGNDSRFLVHS